MIQLPIQLPRYFNINSTHRFVASVIRHDGTPMAGRLVFDFDGLNFIDGAGMTVFANTLEWLFKRGVEVRFINHDRRYPGVRYLDDCGFFATYLGGTLLPGAAPRDTTRPVTKISHAQSYAWVEFDLTPWLAARLNISQASLATVKTCFKEIFNNIRDHSTEDIGCVHVQFYPNINTIQATISDFGVGIPAAIRSRYQANNDGAAILLATEQGISTKDEPTYRGAGLRELVDYVTIGNRGWMSIYSAFGGANFRLAPGGLIGATPWVGTGYYPGTLINIEFRTDTIENVPDEREDLEW